MRMNAVDPIDLRLLHTFAEVARSGSVSAAARSLARSQPAISHRLKALEADLGVALFERVGRGLQLTEHGRRLEAECGDLLALSAGVRQRLVGGDRVSGRVTIGTLPTLSSHLLVPAVADLLSAHDELELAFVFDFVPALCGHLRTGRVDVVVAIGTLPPLDVDARSVGDTPLVAAMAPWTAPRRTGEVSLDELRALRYLAWDGPRDATFGAVARFTDAHRLSVRATPRIPHIETLRELAAAGAGYTILPAYTVRRDLASGRLVALSPEGLDQAQPVHVIGRPGQMVAPALAAVRERLLELNPSAPR